MRIQFASQSYQHRHLPVSAQRLVNLYAEQQPTDAKSQIIVRHTPGLSSFATVGTGPIRGMAVMDGVLYVVSGTSVFKVLSNGTATSLGTIPGTGTVSMAASGTQLVVVTNPDAYVVTSTTVTEITDADFPGASAVCYLDGYFIFVRPDTGQFFISALLDAASFDALDFASAESAPDDLVTAVVDHRELWLFGSTSTEVWVNTGQADFPFERQPGSLLEKGIAAARSAAQIDNSIFWLANDLMVYRAEGYAPKRISTHALEDAISGYSTVSDAISFVYADAGHTFFILTFPTAGHTWVYDCATGLWHERESYASGDSIGRWRASSYAWAYNKHLIGDYSTGTVWQMSPTTYAEGSNALVRIACTPPLQADRARAFMSSFQLDMDTGSTPLGTGQGSDPQMALQWSDDGGRTWSSERWASLGRIGEYLTRVIWRRCGHFRQRVLKVTVSDPVPVVIITAYADVEAGES